MHVVQNRCSPTKHARDRRFPCSRCHVSMRSPNQLIANWWSTNVRNAIGKEMRRNAGCGEMPVSRSIDHTRRRTADTVTVNGNCVDGQRADCRQCLMSGSWPVTVTPAWVDGLQLRATDAEVSELMKSVLIVRGAGIAFRFRWGGALVLVHFTPIFPSFPSPPLSLPPVKRSGTPFKVAVRGFLSENI